MLTFILGIQFTGWSQNQEANLLEFSPSSLLLGEWKLVGVQNDFKSYYVTSKPQDVRKEDELVINFSKDEMLKRKGEQETTFTYEVLKDSLNHKILLKEGEKEYSYSLIEVNHFSLTISSEVEISTGLDNTTETVYYTYLRVESEYSQLKDILGTWRICSDSVIEDFSSGSTQVYRFYKTELDNCEGVSKMDLEITNSGFQLLQNVSLANEKSYKFISSNLLVNLDKNLIYFKLNKGLVFDIVTLTNEVLE
ncbi:hypothetical protein, partial [Lishizhenia sp.]|uniref:hypothetical protein n=1 Tax=Lishizhenia sp. TaxID=2497594 RepID=UPI00299D6F97